MNTKDIIAISIIALFIIVVGCLAHVEQKEKHDYELNTIVITNETIDSLKNIQNIQEKYYLNKIDSLNKEIAILKKVVNEADSVVSVITEELTVANYKLERIKYYNTIAAKGNNITFLRGWVNRVLDE